VWCSYRGWATFGYASFDQVGLPFLVWPATRKDRLGG
jgi:hypothetical protein